MKVKIFISFAVAALLCGNLSAITLSEAVGGVVTKNPGIKSKLNAYKQEVEAYKIAKDAYNPTIGLDASIGKEKTNSKSTSYKDIDMTPKTITLSAKQNIFDGFGTKLKIEQANNDVYVAAYDYIGVANELATSLVELYMGILQEKEILSIEKNNYETHEKMFDDIKKKYDSGLGKISDVKEVKSKLSYAYANYIGQEQTLNEKIIQFNSLYGDLVDISVFEKPNIQFSLPKIYTDAENLVIANNPSIKMKEYGLLAAKNVNMYAKKEYFPKLDLKLSKSKSYDQSGLEGTTDSTNAMVVMSYNLYNGGIDENNIQKSLSNVLQKQEELFAKKQEELKKLQLFYINKDMTEKRMEHLNAYVFTNKEKLMSYKEEFELGRRSLLDLLGAEDDYNGAKKQLIRAMYDYDITKYKILYSMGGLLEVFGVAIEKGFIKNDRSVNIEAYKADALVDFIDLDNDKIDDTKDLCLNSTANAMVNSSGCLKNANDYGTKLKPIETLNDVSKEKDIVALNDVSSANDMPKKIDGSKKYRLKNFSFLRHGIDGDVEYVWPTGILIEGLQKEQWIEVKKRLGAKGEVLGEFRLWISSSDVEEL